MNDKTAVEQVKRLHCTTDAQVWAKEFNTIFIGLHGFELDEGWLIGWFANAIEIGRDAGRQLAMSELTLKVEHPGSDCRHGRAKELDGRCSVCDCGLPSHAECCKFVASMLRSMRQPALADRVIELIEENAARSALAPTRLREALNRAAYALFQIKRMVDVPQHVSDFVRDEHEQACAVLNDETTPSHSRAFRFDRIRRGKVMAEGIEVHAATLKEATAKAEKMADVEDDDIRLQTTPPTTPQKPGELLTREHDKSLRGAAARLSLATAFQFDDCAMDIQQVCSHALASRYAQSATPDIFKAALRDIVAPFDLLNPNLTPRPANVVMLEVAEAIKKHSAIVALIAPAVGSGVEP